MKQKTMRINEQGKYELTAYGEEKTREYFGNNARKLYKKVDKMVSKFGGIKGKAEYDYFYCVADECFFNVLKHYDGEQSFDGLLHWSLTYKIRAEMTSRNRYKRQADRMAISIHTEIGEDGTYEDIIPDPKTVEGILFEGQGKSGYSEKARKYLKRLSPLQRKVLELTIVGYKPNEIKVRLHLTDKDYADCCASIRSYRNVSTLF